MNYQYHNYDIITNIDNVKDIMKEIKSSPIKKEDYTNTATNDNVTSSSQLSLVAQKARHHLKLLSEKSKYECGNANLFKPYDTYKSNVITYDDLNSSLIRSNANITKKDAYKLASVLDKNETGTIHYDNIIIALKEIEDEGFNKTIQPTTSASTSSSLLTNNNEKPHILSPEARDILNRLKNNPYTFDEASASPQSLSPNIDHTNNNNNNENINLYPPTYEGYIKRNPDYHEFLSHPRRHVKQINDFQYDLYRPAPYYCGDLYSGAFPPKPNKDIKEKRFRSKSAPPPNQINSLAFEENKIKKTGTVTKSSSKSLYEQLMLAKTKNIGDYVNLEELDTTNNTSYSSDIVTSPIVKESTLSATTQSSRKKEIVNSLITQLKGKLMPLRIQLKKFDGSNSGLVNMNEFVAALGSTGIVAPRKQLIDLFKESSHRVDDTSKGHYGVYENSYAVKIDDFISTMQEKAYNSHSGLVSDKDKMKNRMREDSRIFKKLLHATEKVGGDIHQYFISQDADCCGWIQPTKLKEAFRHLGANVTEDEFSKIVSKLDKSDGGLVNVHNLDTTLNKYVHDYDTSSYDNSMIERSSHSRYNNTYRPQHYFGKTISEYDEVRRAKLLRKERMQWAKLRNKLVTSYDVLNKVFASSPDKHADFLDRRIDIHDIQRSLARAGIQLGSDDTNRLKAHLQDFKSNILKENSNSSVSAKELCLFLDPRYSHNDLKSIDPDKMEEGGVFSQQLRVPHSGNSTFDSSFFSHNDVFEKSLGSKRRKRADAARVTDSSRYWLLEHESIIDPDFKYGNSFIPAFLHEKPYDTPDLGSATASNSIQMTSNMLKQPYHALKKGGNEHQYGRRNSTQTSSISQESPGDSGPYRSSRKLRLPFDANDSLNDSIGSYASSDSRGSNYDIARWAAKSLSDFMAAKKSLGLSSAEGEQTPKRVSFDTSDASSVKNNDNSNSNNIYLNSSQGKAMRGGLKRSNSKKTFVENL